MADDSRTLEAEGAEARVQFGQPRVVEVTGRRVAPQPADGHAPVVWESKARVIREDRHLYAEAERQAIIAANYSLEVRVVARVEVHHADEVEPDAATVANWATPAMALTAYTLGAVVFAMAGLPLMTPPGVRPEQVESAQDASTPMTS